MPRPLRIQDAGYLHHVVCRGNNSQFIFHSAADFQTYLELLIEAKKTFPVKIYNYVLMDNHIHLLVEPAEDGSLSKFMEQTSKAYAKYFNKVYDRVGHLFQGRFKSFLVQGERYYFSCSRYIDLNPVKGGLVAAPQDYVWSGYNTLAHGKKTIVELDTHELYTNMGTTAEERQISYRALVLSGQWEDLNLLERRVCVLGDAEFKEKVKVA